MGKNTCRRLGRAGLEPATAVMNTAGNYFRFRFYFRFRSTVPVGPFPDCFTVGGNAAGSSRRDSFAVAAHQERWPAIIEAATMITGPGSENTEVTVAKIAKGHRVTGSEREELTKELVGRYESGASIRELATETARSYGFIHRILKDAGVELRGRGGATRRKK